MCGKLRSFEVKKREQLRKLLERNKIKLERGRAFYQMTKVIQRLKNKTFVGKYFCFVF